MNATARDARLGIVGCLAVLVLALVAACSGETYQRYDGSAWPNRRPDVAWPDASFSGVTTDNGSDTLSVIDLAGPRTVGRYPIGFDPLGIDGPHHLAIDLVDRVLFTALSFPAPMISPGPHGTHGFSTVPGTLVRLSLDDFRVLHRADVDYSPGDVVLTPDRTRVIVSHFDLARAMEFDAGADGRRGSVWVFDARTLARLHAPIVAGVGIHGMAVTPDSRLLLVTANIEDVLVLIALDRLDEPVVRIPIGPGGGMARYGPYSVTLSADGAVAFVANRDGRDVRRFDVVSRTFDDLHVAGLRAAAMFSAIGPGGATLLVPTQAPDQLVLLRTDTLELVRVRRYSRDECQLPHQVNVSPDGRYFVVCEGDHVGPGAVLAVDPDSLEILGRTTVGVYPDAIAFVPRGAGR